VDSSHDIPATTRGKRPLREKRREMRRWEGSRRRRRRRSRRRKRKI